MTPADERRLPCSVLVLAGGRARRLGGEKAGVRVGGASLLQRVLAACTEVADEVLLLPRERSVVLPPDFPRPLHVVPDAPGLEGPLAGLVAGLEAAQHELCLLLPCDLPFADPRAVARLLRLARANDAPVVVPFADGVLQPLHGVYRRSRVLPVLRRHVAAGGRSLLGLLDTTGALAVEAEALLPGAAGRFLRDVDTPADLALAREECS